jgi:hypothetical protein
MRWTQVIDFWQLVELDYAPDDTSRPTAFAAASGRCELRRRG